jgi:hypothetical protein
MEHDVFMKNNLLPCICSIPIYPLRQPFGVLGLSSNIIHCMQCGGVIDIIKEGKVYGII